MKPVIVIHNYYENIYITLGKAIDALVQAGQELQVETLVAKFCKHCESHGQCMDIISHFVDIIEEQPV